MGRNKNSKQLSQTMRNKKIVQDAMCGISNDDLAMKYGLEPPTISQIINHSPEAIQMSQKVDDGFDSMLNDAYQAVREVMKLDTPENASNRLKAAQMVFDRTLGKVVDKIESRNVHEINNITDKDLVEKAKKIINEVEGIVVISK